jgi:FHA domain/von Willebrand factor type A domain
MKTRTQSRMVPIALALTFAVARAVGAQDAPPGMPPPSDATPVAEAPVGPPVPDEAAPTAQVDDAAAKPLDVVLVLDNSGSMRRNDPQALMRPIVQDLAARLAPESRLGLVLFDEVAKPVLALTEIGAPGFRPQLDAALAQLTYRGQRTEIAGGVERAVYELRTQGRPDADRAVVFLTDGIVDVGSEARNRERAAWLRDTVAAEAKDAGILIFGIAFTEKADFSLIQALAQTTGGGYRRILAAGEISGAFEQVHERLAEIARKSTEAEQQSVEEALRAAEAAQQVEASQQAAAEARERAEAAQRQAAEATQQLAAAKQEAGEAGRRAETATQRAEDAARGAEAARQEAVDAKLDAAAAKALAEQKPPVIRKNQRIVQRFPIPMDWRPLVFGVSGLVVVAIVALVALRGRRGVLDAAMPAAKLRDLREGAKGKTYKLKKGVLRIGRSKDNDVVLPHETISAHHAVVEWRDGSFYVKDFGSTNGTRRNGTPFSDRKEMRSVRVKHRDRLAFDQYEFELVVGAAEQVAETVVNAPLGSGTLEGRRGRSAEGAKLAPVPGDLPATGGRAGGSSGEGVTRLKPQHKCAEHPSCDATERCPACSRTWCEWCITEKDGKVMCVACAQQAA